MPTAQKHRKKWREFEEAREYVRGLGLRSQKEWTEYAGSGQKPSDIPADPRKVYKEAGWHSMGDWLGTGYVANQERQYRPFEEAREFARSLGLKNSDEWRAWGRRGERPLDIPSNPNTTYRAHWSGWGDWLRSEDAPSRWRSFEEAREYARSLGLKGSPQWREYCMSGQRPHDIPAAPTPLTRTSGRVIPIGWARGGGLSRRLGSMCTALASRARRNGQRSAGVARGQTTSPSPLTGCTGLTG